MPERILNYQEVQELTKGTLYENSNNPWLKDRQPEFMIPYQRQDQTTSIWKFVGSENTSPKKDTKNESSLVQAEVTQDQPENQPAYVWKFTKSENAVRMIVDNTRYSKD